MAICIYLESYNWFKLKFWFYLFISAVCIDNGWHLWAYFRVQFARQLLDMQNYRVCLLLRIIMFVSCCAKKIQSVCLIVHCKKTRPVGGWRPTGVSLRRRSSHADRENLRTRAPPIYSGTASPWDGTATDLYFGVWQFQAMFQTGRGAAYHSVWGYRVNTFQWLWGNNSGFPQSESI